MTSVELTPRQQADLDLLSQSGMGGLFFTIGAVALSAVEPLIWQSPWVAAMFLTLLAVMMAIRLYFYFTLPAMTGFVLPKLYYLCLLGNAGVWGIYATWIVSLPPEPNASSAITLTLSAGAACGGSVAMAMNLRLARALMLLYIVPLVLYLLLNPYKPQLFTLGFLLIIFLVYLYSLSSKQNQSYWKMIGNTEKLRKQTQELVEARNEAVKANNARTEFLGHISQEIRTPLNGILGVAETLGNTPLDPYQQDQVNVILQSARLVQGLINDVMDFSQVNAGNVLLGPVDVDLRELAHSTLNVLEPLVRPSGNRIDFADGLDGNNWVRVDRLRLQQLLTNLLSNANKFTQNGRIELRMLYLPGPRPEQDLLRCEVHDDGVGMTPAQQKQLFDEYYHVSKSDPNSRGAGLGLAICSRLIKLLGGRLGVKSDKMHGSCFWFEIPFVRGVAVETPAYVHDQISEARPFSILVVEDNLMNQKVITAFLNKLQIDYAVAESGGQAVELYEKNHHTHVLLDIGLPDFSGMEVAKRIRRSEQERNWPNTVIVAVTAHDANKTIQECFDAGMNDHLPKPVTLRSLQNMLDKWGN